jgi:O-antigen ligase
MAFWLSVALWAMCWGGMFTGLYHIDYLKSSNPFTFFQGIRMFFPLLAMYASGIWLFKERRRFPFARDPVGFFFLYALIGLASSVFLHPGAESHTYSSFQGAYWVSVYFSPLIVIWAVVGESRVKERLQAIMYLNYVVFFFLMFALFPSAVRIFRGRAAFSAFYNLPFGFGQVTKNGAARYAMVVIIVAGMRFLTEKRRRRYVWLVALAPALFLLMQTQSRTGLLGLAVVGVLYVFVRGLDWRYILALPIIGFIVYVSGFKMRAEGRLDMLLDLSGRGGTWAAALKEIGRSPFLGWGFDADRMLLEGEQMHNSYLHATIQAGVLGGLCFLAAFAGLWFVVLRSGLLRSVRRRTGVDKIVLMESILIMGFLTSRGFFESTAAFFGLDQLLVIPAMAYIGLAASEPVEDDAESIPVGGTETA